MKLQKNPVSILPLIQMAVLALTVSPALAFADPAVQFDCQVKEVKFQEGDLQKSPVLAVQLKCPLSTVTTDGQVPVWAPATEQARLESLRDKGATAHFTLTSNYSGIVLAIEGHPVGEIDPLGARNRSVTVIDTEQSATFLQAGKVLDHLGVNATARHACNPRNASSPCFDVKDRVISLEQYVKGSNLFDISIGQIGGVYSYGTWGDGYVRISVNGLSDQPHGNVITLSASDSAAVRAKFRLGAKAVFENPHSADGKLTRVTFEDNGQNIRITTVGSN